VILHEPQQWPTGAALDRPRRWQAWVRGPGRVVVASWRPILDPGEDLTEYPPTVELTWTEWGEWHDRLGLDTAGTWTVDPAEPLVLLAELVTAGSG
jgi:hypothetical protein